MADLLPQNATRQERALSGSVARLADVPVPLRESWNPDTCPSSMLAWLAWAFSVDRWDSDWTEEQQRAFIKRSVEIHRHKGTIGAVREGLAALGIDVRVQEWFNQSPPGERYTFSVEMTADQTGIDEAALQHLFAIIERTKNLRSHITSAALTVRSVVGPCMAIAAGVGHDICLTGFQWSATVVNETTIVLG